MRLTTVQSVIIIASVVLGAQVTRWLPFLIFPENKKLPPVIQYLGMALPPAMMAFLVVFCVKSCNLMTLGKWLPEALAIISICVLHKWKHNMMLSIISGTIVYMLLVQFVFI